MWKFLLLLLKLSIIGYVRIKRVLLLKQGLLPLRHLNILLVLILLLRRWNIHKISKILFFFNYLLFLFKEYNNNWVFLYNIYILISKFLN